MTLIDQLDYTPGQISHKTIIDNASGRVVLMAFDRGTALGTHTAPAVVLVQILEGTCEFTFEDEIYTLGPGEFITMHPGARHSLRAPEPFKMLLTKLNS